MIAVFIMGILVTVAVPIYTSTLKRQKAKDCLDQCAIVEFYVHAVMSGTEDNGRKIAEIKMPEGTTYYTFCVHSISGGTQQNPTLEKFRYGYVRSADNRPASETAQNYMQKDISERTLSSLLAYGDIPVCPFQDEDKGEYHEYRIYSDGTVRCTCQDAYPELYD